MLRLALLATLVTGCYVSDPDADSDALMRFGQKEAAKRRAAERAAEPPVLDAIRRAVPHDALDGAWLVPMTAGTRPLALAIHGDRAALVDERGVHDARVTWPLPCEIDLTFAYDRGRGEEVLTMEVEPIGPDVRLISGVHAVQVGDATIACATGSLYVRDARGACTRWARAGAGWIHVADDCGFVTDRGAIASRQPDLATARALAGR